MDIKKSTESKLDQRSLKEFFYEKYGNRIANPLLAAKLLRKFLEYCSDAQSTEEAEAIFGRLLHNTEAAEFHIGSAFAACQTETRPDEETGFGIGDEESNILRMINERNLSPKLTEEFREQLSWKHSLQLENDLEFEKMLLLSEKVGMKTLRFSIAWGKVVNPDGSINQEEVLRYKRHAERCLEQGVEPVVVLHHFDLPNGMTWQDEDIRSKFLQFGKVMLNALIPVGVRYLIAINEPNVELGARHMFGLWPPYEKAELRDGFKGIRNFFRGSRAMAECGRDFFVLAKTIADQYETQVKVVTAINMAYFDDRNSNGIIHSILKKAADYYDKDMQVAMFKDQNFAYFDILGIQPYWIHEMDLIEKLFETFLKIPIRKLSSNNGQEEKFVLKGTHGQTLDPTAIHRLIEELNDRFPNNTWGITEFGADISSNRLKDKITYLRGAFDSIRKLREEGIKIEFALLWTLVRNWEIIGPDGGGWGNGNGYNFGVVGEPDFTLQEDGIKPVPLILYPDMIQEFVRIGLGNGLIKPEDVLSYCDYIRKIKAIFTKAAEANPLKGRTIMLSYKKQIELIKDHLSKSTTKMPDKDELIHLVSELIAEPIAFEA